MVIVNYRNKKICPDTSKMGLDILSISWILQKWLRTSNLYLGYSRYKIGYSGNGFGHPIYILDILAICPNTSPVVQVYSENSLNSNKTANTSKKYEIFTISM